MRMSRLPILHTILAWVIVPLATAADTPVTRPAAAASSTPATISGRVAAEGGKPLPELIVYLESPDPAARFPAPREPVHVSQREAKFTPSLVVVCVGQAVDFSNDEAKPVEHNVFSRSPPRPFDLGLYRPGTGPKLVGFDKPGPVRLFCSIHRFMDGVIFVCPTPFYARVGPDGAYRIDNVPPGPWRLKTWQRNQRFNEREVTVSVGPGQAVGQDLELTRR